MAGRADADSVGTLQVKATLFKRFGPVACPGRDPGDDEIAS
jgi:hypothetical protein